MKKKIEDAPTVSTGPSIVGTGDDVATWRRKKKKKKLKASYEVGKKPDRELELEGKNMNQLHDLIKQGKTAEEIAKIMKLDVDTIKALMEDRNYRGEYDNYHKKPEQRKRNAGRLRARRFMEKLKKVKKFDKKDVHHKDNDPTNNDPKNLSVTTQKYNRTEPRLREEDIPVAAPAPMKPITPDATFAGMPVFKVANDDFYKCKFGKKKHSRWNTHIDTASKFGKKVYAYAKKHPKQSIIIQHEKNGYMLYLRKYARINGTKSGIMVKKGAKQ